ncbi:MAG: uroporphyrinogen decarboxylase family protein [Haloquadratum sp.]
MSVGTPAAVEYLTGRREEPRPYVPVVSRLAAAVNQVPPEIFLSNATQQANALQSASRLFEPDAVFTGIDTTLVAEALGATVAWSDDAERFETAAPLAAPADVAEPTTAPDRGRLPTAIDVSERLVASLDGPAVVGVVPGPLTTLEATFGDAAGLGTAQTKPVRTALGELGRAFGKAGVDAILVYEDVETLTGGDAAAVTAETLEVVGNITDFYDTPLSLAPNGYDEAMVDAVVEETAPAALLLDTDDPAAAADAHPDVRVGGGITADLLDADPEEITDEIAARCRELPASAFLASGRELPAAVHPTAVHAVREGYDA